MKLFTNEWQRNIIFHYQKGWFHCRSETNQITNENFSLPKGITAFLKRLVAFSEMKSFTIFMSVYFSQHSHSFMPIPLSLREEVQPSFFYAISKYNFYTYRISYIH